MTVEYKEDACISCGVCVKACRTEALSMKDGKIEYFEENAKPSERFRKTLERLGSDGLKEKLIKVYNEEK